MIPLLFRQINKERNKGREHKKMSDLGWFFSTCQKNQTLLRASSSFHLQSSNKSKCNALKNDINKSGDSYQRSVLLRGELYCACATLLTRERSPEREMKSIELHPQAPEPQRSRITSSFQLQASSPEDLHHHHHHHHTEHVTHIYTKKPFNKDGN